MIRTIRIWIEPRDRRAIARRCIGCISRVADWRRIPRFRCLGSAPTVRWTNLEHQGRPRRAHRRARDSVRSEAALWGSALVSSEARAEPQGVTRSERDFVVEVGGRGVTAATALAALGAVALALLLALAAVLALTAALARQQGQRAAVGAQHDLGRVAVLARIIGPLAGLHLALDVDLVALGAELLDDVDQGAEHRHAVPFGALALLARLPILPALAGGEGDRRDPRAVAHGADLRVLAEVADQDDLVHGTSHVRNPSEVIRGRAVSLITGVI